MEDRLEDQNISRYLLVLVLSNEDRAAIHRCGQKCKKSSVVEDQESAFTLEKKCLGDI